MTTKTVRKIIRIDEEKCDGCGLCVPSCVEGALQIVDGKARLVSERYCDGLAACLGECPTGALTIEERTAEEFDEEAVKLYLREQEHEHEFAHEHEEDQLPCGCPSATVAQFDRGEAAGVEIADAPSLPPLLGQWPVQLTLVPPKAPFLQGTDLLLVADCVPFAYAGFHRDFLRDHSLLVACPKLDDYQAHLRKLTAILTESDIKSLTVLIMEVPCCFGLAHMVNQAVQASGKDISVETVTIGVRGEIKS
jgi:Fe-S-cluster-containing hydrogenase component 2